jgi:hypothetical protein
MGQYKVPQDVEAEDKIIGFLTLKQFIYAVIGIAYGLLTFRIFSAAIFIWFIVGVPPTVIFLLLGLYQRQGQPFETYFLALLNYWFKPRKRIWIKENILEVFKLEQPKAKAEELHRDPREVRGQLDKLAQIVDTRGWSSKQPEVQEPDMQPTVDLRDRLQTNEVFNAQSDASEVNMADDILDMKNNPSARNLDVLIEDAEKSVRSQAMEVMKAQGATVPTAAPQTAVGSITEMTTNPTADILKRAMENQDLTVSQIAAQANRPVASNGTLAAGESVNVRMDQAPSGGTSTGTS